MDVELYVNVCYIYWFDHKFFTHFVNVIYDIDWSVDSEKSLHP